MVIPPRMEAMPFLKAKPKSIVPGYISFLDPSCNSCPEQILFYIGLCIYRFPYPPFFFMTPDKTKNRGSLYCWIEPIHSAVMLMHSPLCGGGSLSPHDEVTAGVYVTF